MLVSLRILSGRFPSLRSPELKYGGLYDTMPREGPFTSSPLRDQGLNSGLGVEELFSVTVKWVENSFQTFGMFQVEI
jgi:hypothetical protein